jgi:hypothetical protein
MHSRVPVAVKVLLGFAPFGRLFSRTPASSRPVTRPLAVEAELLHIFDIQLVPV